jgi:hypothetical protein
LGGHSFHAFVLSLKVCKRNATGTCGQSASDFDATEHCRLRAPHPCCAPAGEYGFFLFVLFSSNTNLIFPKTKKLELSQKQPPSRPEPSLAPVSEKSTQALVLALVSERVRAEELQRECMQLRTAIAAKASQAKLGEVFHPHSLICMRVISCIQKNCPWQHLVLRVYAQQYTLLWRQLNSAFELSLAKDREIHALRTHLADPRVG